MNRSANMNFSLCKYSGLIALLGLLIVSGCDWFTPDHGGRTMGSINGFRYRVDYGYRGDDLAYVILQEARTNWPATSELEILIDDKTKERTYRGGIQFPGKPRQKWSELRG